MMRLFRLLIFFIIFVISFVFFVNTESIVYAQSINLDASNLTAKVDLSFSPFFGSFEEDSTFNVPIFLNTRDSSVNGIELYIRFDAEKLAVIQPSGGTSIIGVWIEPPVFDNTRGIVNYVGVVPDGITTSSGLIGTITFKAKKTGRASVSFDSNSSVLLNDGLGTKAVTTFGRAEFTILHKAPSGVVIFSDTHPKENDWYNNMNPVISWEKDEGVEGFSYVFDNKPFTMPENTIMTTETTKSFENLNDGLWYFHIKSNRKGAWSKTGHFLIRIDNTPPAIFTPTINYLLAAPIFVEQTLISFFTTDNLSGVDRYEVGIINKRQPTTISPVFIQTESPFQVSIVKNSELNVIVRAIDKANNIREVSVDVRYPFVAGKFLKDNILYVLILIICTGFVGLIIHYMFGHHILRNLRKIRSTLLNDASNIIESKSEPISDINTSIMKNVEKNTEETNNI